MKRTLVVGAYAPELAGLPPAVATRAVGIGLVAASAGSERAILELAPERIVFIGTAGALPGSGLAIGALVTVARARLAVRAEEYLPAPMAASVAADESLTAAVAEQLAARQVMALCPLGITQSDVAAAHLAPAGEIEHLEVFAVLAAAARAGVPATAILAIANRVGSQAAVEWRTYREAAEAAAKRALMRWLRSEAGSS